MILATGATGGVGRHVVTSLVEKATPVRALVRDPTAANLPKGVELAAGDLADPASLEAALHGVDTVFLLWPFFHADGAPAVVKAITRKTRRVVYLSAEAAAHDPESFWALVERELGNSGAPSTLLRPTGFAKNTYEWADQIRAGVVRAPFGAAARSLIDERDIAAVAVLALTEEGDLGQTYVLTGPATLTQAEQVRIIGEALGKSVRWEEQSLEKARPGLLAAFGDEAIVDASLAVWAGFVQNPEPVTSTVEDLTGTPARTFEQWAHDHIHNFR